jgi:hypothetical protein
MKLVSLAVAVLVLLPSSYTEAATQNFPVHLRIPIVGYGFRQLQRSEQLYPFQVQILSDAGGFKTEQAKHGRPFITAEPDERYSVRLYNPLPVRVAVNLTIDGVNTLSGKPSGISDGEKWLLEPYASVTIRGWQINGAEARRFFFTDKPKSYAKWRGDSLGKDLAANCGVIGAAFFWNQNELDQYWQAHPIMEQPELQSKRSMIFDHLSNEGVSGERLMPALAQAKKMQDAGTGMGERELNPTTQVDFQYDTGMYKLSQAVVIYYDFAQEPVPNPFPELSYAPEMP